MILFIGTKVPFLNQFNQNLVITMSTWVITFYQALLEYTAELDPPELDVPVKSSIYIDSAIPTSASPYRTTIKMSTFNTIKVQLTKPVHSKSDIEDEEEELGSSRHETNIILMTKKVKFI